MCIRELLQTEAESERQLPNDELNSKVSHLTLLLSLNAQVACSLVIKIKTKQVSY